MLSKMGMTFYNRVTDANEKAAAWAADALFSTPARRRHRAG